MIIDGMHYNRDCNCKPCRRITMNNQSNKEEGGHQHYYDRQDQFGFWHCQCGNRKHKDLFSPTPDSMEECRCWCTEETGVMPSINFAGMCRHGNRVDSVYKKMKSPDLTDSWAKEFDKKFGEYGTYNQKNLDALQSEVQFRLDIKSFISEVRQKAKGEVLRDMYSRYDTVGRYTVKKAIVEYAKDNSINMLTKEPPHSRKSL